MNASSQPSAAAYAAWPWSPISAADEEKDNHQSRRCPATARNRCHAPNAFGAHTRSSNSSSMRLMAASSAASAACATPRSGRPVAVAAAISRGAVAGSDRSPRTRPMSVPARRSASMTRPGSPAGPSWSFSTMRPAPSSARCRASSSPSPPSPPVTTYAPSLRATGTWAGGTIARTVPSTGKTITSLPVCSRAAMAWNASATASIGYAVCGSGWIRPAATSSPISRMSVPVRAVSRSPSAVRSTPAKVMLCRGGDSRSRSWADPPTSMKRPPGRSRSRPAWSAMPSSALTTTSTPSPSVAGAHLRGELQRARVIDVLDAHGAQQVAPRLAAGGRVDPRPGRLCERDDGHADAAGGRVDEDALAPLQPGEIAHGMCPASRYAAGIVAASSYDSAGGTRNAATAGSVTNEAIEPGAKAATRSPGRRPVTPSPTAMTSPAQSSPNDPRRTVRGGAYVAEAQARGVHPHLDLAPAGPPPPRGDQLEGAEVARSAQDGREPVLSAADVGGASLARAQRRTAQPRGVPRAAAPGDLVLDRVGEQLGDQVGGVAAVGVHVDVGDAKTRMLRARDAAHGAQRRLFEVGHARAVRRTRLAGHHVQARARCRPRRARAPGRSAAVRGRVRARPSRRRRSRQRSGAEHDDAPMLVAEVASHSLGAHVAVGQRRGQQRRAERAGERVRELVVLLGQHQPGPGCRARAGRVRAARPSRWPSSRSPTRTADASRAAAPSWTSSSSTTTAPSSSSSRTSARAPSSSDRVHPRLAPDGAVRVAEAAQRSDAQRHERHVLPADARVRGDGQQARMEQHRMHAERAGGGAQAGRQPGTADDAVVVGGRRWTASSAAKHGPCRSPWLPARHRPVPGPRRSAGRRARPPRPPTPWAARPADGARSRTRRMARGRRGRPGTPRSRCPAPAAYGARGEQACARRGATEECTVRSRTSHGTRSPNRSAATPSAISAYAAPGIAGRPSTRWSRSHGHTAVPASACQRCSPGASGRRDVGAEQGPALVPVGVALAPQVVGQPEPALGPQRQRHVGEARRPRARARRPARPRSTRRRPARSGRTAPRLWSRVSVGRTVASRPIRWAFSRTAGHSSGSGDTSTNVRWPSASAATHAAAKRTGPRTASAQ